MRKVMGLWALVLISGAGPAGAQTKAEPPELDALRAALKKYEDPYVAVHDGYFSTVGCMVIEKAGGPGQVPYKPGGMGIHFINLGAVGPVPDPKRPTVLLYEPEGGKLRLTGAEWFVPLAASKERPSLWGQQFDGPMMGHPPLLPAEMTHWDLHVWLYKKNPLGIFASTNPAVKCAGTPYRLVEEPSMLVADTKP
jgi:hypothetical protein